MEHVECTAEIVKVLTSLSLLSDGYSVVTIQCGATCIYIQLLLILNQLITTYVYIFSYC
jgi:hypothetical protein